VSIARRLLNLARAELRGAFDGFRDGRSSAWPPPPETAPREPEERAQGASEERRQEPPRRRRGADLDDAELRRYYANLELPLGAPAGEVKASYRRLVRRYHPDRHQSDPEQARIATQLAQELRVAYEALMQHLGRSA
jgi:hypothetical protein